MLSAIDRGECEPYWVNTSSNKLIRELVLRATADQHLKLKAVLQGTPVRKRLSTNTVLREVYADSEALWSFLVFSGYLSAHDVRQEEDTSITAALSIPNRELRVVFSEVFNNWLTAGLGGRRQVEDMTRALLRGDIEEYDERLDGLESASVMDTTARGGVPPEQLYHVFLLGLLIFLHGVSAVRSNRESGFGRADVMVVPREAGKPGVVMELKVRRRVRRWRRRPRRGCSRSPSGSTSASCRRWARRRCTRSRSRSMASACS